MYGYVYITTNLINNKKYIGQHRSDVFEPNKYLGSGLLLIKAIEKYGVNNFKCELLEECDSEDSLNEREKYWIKHFGAADSECFYNVARGGEGHTCEPWNKGKHGVQVQTELSLQALERGRHLPASENLKRKLSEYRTNVIVSEDTRKKLSEAQKGKRVVHNHEVNILIYDYQLDEYLSNGWVLGRDKNLVRFSKKDRKKYIPQDKVQSSTTMG